MNDAQLKLSSQICFPLYSASRLITKAYKPYLDEMGLHPQYLVLLVLWKTMDFLCKSNYREAALEHYFPLLKRMEKWNLQRTRSIEDERSVIVQLTEKEVLKSKPNPFLKTN
jgi:hypothetical protein